MKALLLNPPFRRRIGNIWRYISGVLPPLGLGYIAATLERAGIDVDIVDAPAEKIDFKLLPRRIGEGRYDLIGITATTTMFPSAIATARLMKELFPSARVVMGGVHATARPEEALAEAAVDMVVSGEGENTFLELARGSNPHDTLGVITRDEDGAIAASGPRPLIDNLDDLPYPAYHKMPMRLYRPAIGGYRHLPAFHMLTSRGCSHHCTYCYHIFGHGVRFRSSANVLEELKYMVERYGVREVYFYDDTFNMRRKRVEEICEGLLRMKLGVEWSCLARVNNMDPELLALMKRAGCHAVSYGVESADPEILKNIRKQISLDDVERVVRYTAESGIVCRVGFMLGNPGETRESMRRTIQYAIKLSSFRVGFMFNIVAPYPGTEMFEWGVKNGFIKNFNWEEYDFSTPIMEIPGLPPSEIIRTQRNGHRRLFLRPSFVRTVVSTLNTPAGIKQAMLGTLTVTGALEAYDRFNNFLRGHRE